MVKKIVIGLVALFVIIGIAGAVGGKKKGGVSAGSATTQTTAPKTTTTAQPSAYAVGQTAKTSGFEVTVFAFKDPQPPGQYDSPAAGSHYVSVDVQVRNPGTTQQPFSSVLGFHLLDSANRQYDEALATSVTPGAPDGEIAGGQAVRGYVVFEVPDGTPGLRLRVQGSATAAGAVFRLT